MVKILNANKYEEMMMEHTHTRRFKGRNPKIVILMASDNKASERYVANKIKMGEKLNIDVELITHDETVTNKELEKLIVKLNNDNTVDGMILQLPVYEHLDSKYLIDKINPKKDVDGLTSHAKAKLETNELKLMPCTPLGVIKMLECEDIEIKGKNVVVVGKGETAGAPMATTFRNLDTTVTICHKETSREDLEFYIRHADIVISCVGIRNLLEPDWFKEGSIAIGVGFTYDENGKQHLDFDVDKVVELGKAYMVSQRTNCTGKATVLSLMYNTLLAYLNN